MNRTGQEVQGNGNALLGFEGSSEEFSVTSCEGEWRVRKKKLEREEKMER